MVGIVQEQHPARTRLFMQWQGMDWPVMVDSLNLLGVKVVPITLLSVPNPPELVSDEPRRLELELASPAGFTGKATVPGYALYYVCEDVKGTCLYRRQDLELRVRAAE